MDSARSKTWEKETGVHDDRRFALELEFVQCLANPAYLNWLSQERYFDDPSFLKYLQYLQYWKRPEYSRYIIYPHALYFLDMVQRPDFRQAIADPNYKELVHSQQLLFWLHWPKIVAEQERLAVDGKAQDTVKVENDA